MRVIRRWLVLVAGVAVAASCLGSTVAPAHARPAAQSSTGCVADAELKPGDYGSSVICLQYALGMLGLSDQPINGIYDDATSAVVRWFQATNPPLRADGRAGPQTLAALGIWSGKTVGATAEPPCTADATIRPGDASPSVRCMQQALRELGLYDGEITGVSDLPTVGALQRYQADTPPLEVDGFGGPRTLASLGIWSGKTGLFSSGGTVVFANPTTPPPGGAVSGPSTGIAGGPAPAGPWPAPMTAEKNWTLTAEGIPAYAGRLACTRAQADVIAYQFSRDGADVATQQWAVYIASREGGCRFDAVNQNAATQDDSHCTYQLNVLAGMFGPTATLGKLGWTAENVKASLDNCANAASDLWVYCGRGPWTPPYSCRAPWKDAASPVGGTVPATPANPAPGVPSLDPNGNDVSDGGD